MKNILLTAIMMTMVLTIASCSTKTDEHNREINDVTHAEDINESKIDEDLESLIEKTYAATGLEFPQFAFMPLSKENQSYMLGVDSFDFIEGVVSEPMMTSQAHSFVMFRVDEGSDIEKIKEEIKANVDGRKWICVGVEPENIIVDHIGNLVILIMDERSQAIHEAFLDLVN